MRARIFKPQRCQTHLIQHGSEHERCALWAGMGVGKTVTTLTLLNNLWDVGSHERSLVLGPKRVAKNVWPFEQKKWRHLDNLEVSPIIGTPEQRRAALRADANVFTINYENIPWLLHELGRKRWPFGNIIADEATKLKGFRLVQGKQRARYIASIAWHNGIVKRWINLTGTPAPNGLQDLWGPMWMLDQGERLGRSYSAYMQRYFRKSWDGYGQELMPYSDILIHDKVDDICRSVEHELDTQKPIISNVVVDLPAKGKRIYQQMERKMFAEIGGFDVEVMNSANKSMKCLQIASGACYVDREKNWEWIHDAKIEGLESVINEFAGMPILLVYWWKPTLTRLKKHFGDRLTYFDDSKDTEDRWNAGKIPLLAAHPASAGHGVSLQDGGNVICYFDQWWDLELDQQVFERIGPVRQAQAGHDRPVYRVNIIARDTVDAVVARRLITKGNVQDALVNAAKRRTRGQQLLLPA